MALDSSSYAYLCLRPGTLGLVFGALILLGATVSAAPRPLGQFEDHADIGAPKLAGDASYNGFSQQYTLVAGGVNLWGPRDEFQFAWKRLSGDFILQTRVEFLGKGVDPHRKAGFMVRSSLDEASPYADVVAHGDGLTSLQFRKAKSAVTEQIESALKGADVLEIERKGTRFIMRVPKFGEPYVTSELPELALGDEVFVGRSCAHTTPK